MMDDLGATGVVEGDCVTVHLLSGDSICGVAAELRKDCLVLKVTDAIDGSDKGHRNLIPVTAIAFIEYSVGAGQQ